MQVRMYDSWLAEQNNLCPKGLYGIFTPGQISQAESTPVRRSPL